MEEDYTINEVIDFDCDNEGLLSVTLRLEGDPDDKVRFLESDEYYYYAENICKEEDIYMSKEWDEGDYEGIGNYYSHFDFKEWKEYEHNEGTIREFIYENYKKEDLPVLTDE